MCVQPLFKLLSLLPVCQCVDASLLFVPLPLRISPSLISRFLCCSLARHLSVKAHQLRLYGCVAWRAGVRQLRDDPEQRSGGH
jgi:hypothetical protein